MHRYVSSLLIVIDQLLFLKFVSIGKIVFIRYLNFVDDEDEISKAK